MPIAVICPSCKAAFRVSDKFAGRKGPCPKCKATIEIPKPEEVQIHGAEAFAEGGRDTKGQLITKPIARKDAKLGTIQIVLLVGGTITSLVLTAVLGRTLGVGIPVVGVGLLVLGFPICVGAYVLLRNDELEPYRGTSLWIRAGITSVGYAALWGIFYLVPESAMTAPWNWFLIVPPFLVVGALAAFACLDLDFANGFFHYSFYLLVTLLLRYLIGMPAIWVPLTVSTS
jgi:predicted Zn finger-like uncharacterized protein